MNRPLTPSYTKLKPSGRWGVRVPLNGSVPKAGDVVTVVKRSGESNDEVLGACAHAFEDAMLFEIAQPQKTPGPVAVRAGVFEKDGETYVVQANRAKTRVYAKKLVGQDEWEYAPGIVYRLTEKDRVDAERAALIEGSK